MASVGDILSRALRYCGVVPAEQSANGYETLIALDNYNDIMFEFSNANAFTLKKPDGTVYTHTEQDSIGDFPLDDRFVGGLAGMVAIRTAPMLSLEEQLNREAHSAASRGYGAMSGAFGNSVTQDYGLLRRDRFYS